jgi:adenylate cyclase
MERKLAAIFSTDVKGYSRLMGEDEVATIHTLTAYREVMTTLIQQHRGRVVDSPGDNLLAEFASVVEAVQCAVAIQQELKARNAELPPHRRMEFRIGINLGDVIAEGERLYGDRVNIAARLEGLAEAGGLCISGTVYDQVKTRLALDYEDLGVQAVKNIAEPVRVYRVHLEPRARAPAVRQPQRLAAKTWWRGALAVVGLVLLLGGGVTVWQRVFRPPASPGVGPAKEVPTLPWPDKPSIAVLPFVNLSGDPAQEYFSDGMTEVLITDLSKVADLFVIARNSVFTYKGKAVKPEQVGRELGVRYVLEGSVLKAGDKVRITAQLVDATTAYHLWAERYDRDLQDIFALQDELTQKILLALKVKLTPAEQARFRHAPTSNLEAYDVFLRGWEASWRFTKEANAQARQLFEHAIALDPQYAAAYAALSATQLDTWYNWEVFRFSLDQIFALAQRAVELDASLPLAHSVLGYVYLTQKQHAPAIAAAERALALDPNFAYGHVALAVILTHAGRPQDAVGLIEKAMRLDPAHPPDYFVSLSHAYYLAGRYEEAIAAAQSALARNPNLSGAHDLLVLSYSELGREAEARAAVQELLRVQPGISLEAWQLKIPYKDPAIVARQLDLLQRAGLKWRFPTDNPEALGAFWAGLEAEARHTPEGNAEARQQFARAIALDPQYVMAYAHLGRTYFQEWDWGSIAPQVLERALELTQQAIALDASVPWFHRRLSEVYLRQKRHAPALAAAERAVALDPNDGHNYVVLAQVLSYTGQPEKAIGLVKKAMRLNPQYPDWYVLVLGWSYALLERYEEAIAALQSLLARNPEHLFAHLRLAAIYSAAGREAEARAEAAEVLRIDPEFSLEWLRPRLPFQEPAALDRHLATLRQTGLK